MEKKCAPKPEIVQNPRTSYAVNSCQKVAQCLYNIFSLEKTGLCINKCFVFSISQMWLVCPKFWKIWKKGLLSFSPTLILPWMFLLAYLINEKIIHLTENWIFSYPNLVWIMKRLALLMADSSEIKAIACFKEVTLTCVPRPSQQISHNFLQEEISKCTGKVHLEHLEGTVLWLHLNKGLGIPVGTWSSVLAIETAVEKDHLQ